MTNFKVGDTVICIKGYTSKLGDVLVTGKEYTVKEIHNCGCSTASIYVGINYMYGTMCRSCGTHVCSDKWVHCETRFVKAEKNFTNKLTAELAVKELERELDTEIEKPLTPEKDAVPS